MMKKAFKFEVRDEKKIRVIVDTDAACEADDPFAIAACITESETDYGRDHGRALC